MLCLQAFNLAPKMDLLMWVWAVGILVGLGIFSQNSKNWFRISDLSAWVRDLPHLRKFGLAQENLLLTDTSFFFVLPRSHGRESWRSWDEKITGYAYLSIQPA